MKHDEKKIFIALMIDCLDEMIKFNTELLNDNDYYYHLIVECQQTAKNMLEELKLIGC